MKKLPIHVIALSAVLLWHPGYAQIGAMRLCYEDVDNYPWHVKGGLGLSNQLVDMAAARSGVKIEQVALPWKRCLLEIERGNMAGGFGSSYSEERAVYAVYPTTADGKIDTKRRLKTDGYSLYRLKGSAVSWDGKQFSHLTGAVGAQIGYSVIGDLKKLGVATEEASGGADVAMRKLVLKRIQLAAVLTNEGDELITDGEFAGKIEKISPPLTEKPYFVMFNKGFYGQNKGDVEDLWDALAVARESKEFLGLRKQKPGLTSQ